MSLQYGGSLLEFDRELTIEAIRALEAPDSGVLAVRVANYVDPALCERLHDAIVASDVATFERYRYAPQMPVSKIGMNFGEACLAPALMESYFDTAADSESRIRRAFSPLLGPIDKLRMDLDALWPGGAEVARCAGRRMLSGILRRTELAGDIPAHQDDILQEYPGIDWRPYRELVSNVYLSAPPEGGGGELEVFDLAPDYHETMHEVGTSDYYDTNGDYLTAEARAATASAPSVVIKPRRGDLILFVGKCVHRVHKVTAGSRITTCFHIGFVGRDQPLRCWC